MRKALASIGGGFSSLYGQSTSGGRDWTRNAITDGDRFGGSDGPPPVTLTKVVLWANKGLISPGVYRNNSGHG